MKILIVVLLIFLFPMYTILRVKSIDPDEEESEDREQEEYLKEWNKKHQK